VARLLADFYSANSAGCFSEATGVFAGLRGADDEYFLGARLQFEQLLSGNATPGDAEYVLYQEPDCLPVQPGWLDAIRALSRDSEPFWVKGSMFQGDVSIMFEGIPWAMGHINGNAIFNVGDPLFRAFYFGALQAYLDKEFPNMTQRTWDTDMAKYLLDPRQYPVARRLVHYFRFTAAIQNYWKSDVDVPQLLAQFPRAVLVHGGNKIGI